MASLRRYRDALDIRVLPTSSSRNLNEISGPDVEAWITQLVDGTVPSAPCRQTRGWGFLPAGLRSMWMPFNASLAYAQRLGWLATRHRASSSRACGSRSVCT